MILNLLFSLYNLLKIRALLKEFSRVWFSGFPVFSLFRIITGCTSRFLVPRASFQSCCCCSVAESCLCNMTVYDRPPCPSLSPETCSNSCPLSRWCQPTISSLSSPSPPAFNLSKHQALHIRWQKYWSFCFSIRTSSEYSGLISFRID